MGTVEWGFMPLRVAQRWVEIYKKDGMEAANTWYTNSLTWRPTKKEYEKFNEHVNHLIHA